MGCPATVRAFRRFRGRLSFGGGCGSLGTLIIGFPGGFIGTSNRGVVTGQGSSFFSSANCYSVVKSQV